MTTFDAVRAGFRIARRYPGIGAIETIWRTAFTILVVLVILTGSSFFLKNVILSDPELKMLRSKVPVFVSAEVQRLLIRYGPDLWHLFLFVSIFSGVMWLLFASVFRPGIVGMLADAFERERQNGSSNSTGRGFSKDIRSFFGRIGMVNFTYVFFSALVVILSVGVFWGSVFLGVHLPAVIAPWVTIVCVTVGLTLMFFIWAVIDLVTDMAQIAVVFEELSFSASIRRTAKVIQRRFGAVIGIGLVIFVLRCLSALIFGLLNMAANFVLGAVSMPLAIATGVVFWFIQSVLLYYLFVVNLASFACLFEPQTIVASHPLPLSEKIIYEH
ncbi:MAG: hypothetical protein LAO31_17135 [Acidobacteriia bacterium]|nr:hypothetical protein [Terriglobia bacterium]